MRILICTGIYPPDIGGPAQYAKNLAEEFLRRGSGVRVLFYKIEKKLPIGVRHCLYFLRVVSCIRKTDFMLALDTFSAGLPAVFASKIFKKNIVVRIGGDFLWESYVEKSGNLITLKDFNEKMPHLSFKQKIIFFLSRYVFRNASALVFSTEWQRKILMAAYGLKLDKTYIIENYFGEKIYSKPFQEKNFLWAGRLLKLKNLEILKTAFSEAKRENSRIKLDISREMTHDELMKKIRDCYAVILPSLSEISPNLILEAVRFNKPFILTKETGFCEKLKDLGLFVDPFDVADIKNKILFLSQEKNYFEYKSRVQKFNFVHSWAQIADDFLDIDKRL